jgi:hypothetical protein
MHTVAAEKWNSLQPKLFSNKEYSKEEKEELINQAYKLFTSQEFITFSTEHHKEKLADWLYRNGEIMTI